VRSGRHHAPADFARIHRSLKLFRS
jgi:hypothetical protein